jgi:O-antigen/teichoic acid export membrane protein
VNPTGKAHPRTDVTAPEHGHPAAHPATRTRHEEHRDWNRRHRGENDVQRLDRNFLELLQELRVAQTGVQILFAFLLGLAFTARFADLAVWQHTVYVVTLVLSASAAALLIAPVTYHRLVFRRRLKAELVAVTHRYAMTGLALLLASLFGAVNLATSLVIGGWAVPLSVGLAALFVGLWYGVPLRQRRRGPDPDGPGRR